MIKSPFAKFGPTAIIRYFMYLPLNFIPIIGTVLFIILQGKRYGPVAHERYFQLKGWNSTKREQWTNEHSGAYTRYVNDLVCNLPPKVPDRKRGSQIVTLSNYQPRMGLLLVLNLESEW